MNSSTFSFQWLLLIFSIFSISVTATRLEIPRLSPIKRTLLLDPEILAEPISGDFQTFCYTQTLDHFNYRPESYSTFQQKYVINCKYWGGPENNAPIFAYFGAEECLDGALSNIGFLPDNANRFNALLLYIEHRYYGDSIPFRSREEALSDASTLGYFNSAQAIADYAEIIKHVKKKYKAQDSPVIVVGGSYGGMLASWFRLKYPHLALGALASSAPVLYFDEITPQNAFYSIVTKDFREASETCYRTILESWSEIDKVASEPNGLSILSAKFKTCKDLTTSSELTDYLRVSVYAYSAMYNLTPIVCQGIDGAPSETDILDKISAGIFALEAKQDCHVNRPANEYKTTDPWQWQRCSEMVMPLGMDDTTMFPPHPFNLTEFIDECEKFYGVPPRPHWVTTYYGGYDIKLILQRFGSNIIFSNGLKDPYSSGGVLEDISETIVAVKTDNGSHCLDILRANPTSDPDWLVKQREIEVEIIDGWIAQYYADLGASKKITRGYIDLK